MGAVINQGNAPGAKKLTQIKVSVDPEIAAAFKKACAASNVSMAAELTRFMAEYSKCPVKRRGRGAVGYTERRQSRAAIKTFIKHMEQMKKHEENVRDNTPENLQGSVAYESTEEAIASLEEAIEALSAFWTVP